MLFVVFVHFFRSTVVRYLNAVWSTTLRHNNNNSDLNFIASLQLFFFHTINDLIIVFHCEYREIHKLAQQLPTLYRNLSHSLIGCNVTSSSIFNSSSLDLIQWEIERHAAIHTYLLYTALLYSLFIDSKCKQIRFNCNVHPWKIYYVIDFTAHDLLPTHLFRLQNT